MLHSGVLPFLYEQNGKETTMILDEETALARVESPDNLVNKLELKRMYANNTGPKLPPMVRDLLVEVGRLDTQENAAKAFGVTQEDVNYLTNHGKTINRDKIERNVQKVHSAALDAMLEAVGLIKPKLENINKATDLSKVAADLARVVEKTSPKETNITNNLKIVVFRPDQKSERDYEETLVS